MTIENKISRLAGFLYLIVVLTGIFSLAYVPSHINVANDPSATMSNIVAFESLFRWGIASFLLEQVAFLLLPLVLYRLLSPVNPNVAKLMVAFSVVSVPIALLSVVNRLDALSLLTTPYFGEVFESDQLQATAKLSLDAYNHGLFVVKLFWGLWLLPFGYLVFKSGFLPRVLGILLILGGFGYIADLFGNLLCTSYVASSCSKYITLPATIGEIGTCLWLLLVGVRQPKAV